MVDNVTASAPSPSVSGADAVDLDHVRLPSGDVYDMKSQVVIVFPTGKDEKRFIVPGQTFPIVTVPLR